MAEHLPSAAVDEHYAGQHVIDFIFQCEIEPGAELALPALHDDDQIGVAWRPIDDLKRALLKPAASAWLLALARGGSPEFFRQNIWGSE